jgi:hypothetical protein
MPVAAIGQLAASVEACANADPAGAAAGHLPRLVYVTDTFKLVRMGIEKGAKLLSTTCALDGTARLVEALAADRRPFVKTVHDEGGQLLRVTLALSGSVAPLPMRRVDLVASIPIGIYSADFDSQDGFDPGRDAETIMRDLLPNIDGKGRGDKKLGWKGGRWTLTVPMFAEADVKARVNELYRMCNELKVIGVEADGARYTVLIAPVDKLRERAIELGIFKADDAGGGGGGGDSAALSASVAALQLTMDSEREAAQRRERAAAARAEAAQRTAEAAATAAAQREAAQGQAAEEAKRDAAEAARRTEEALAKVAQQQVEAEARAAAEASKRQEFEAEIREAERQAAQRERQRDEKFFTMFGSMKQAIENKVGGTLDITWLGGDVGGGSGSGSGEAGDKRGRTPPEIVPESWEDDSDSDGGFVHGGSKFANVGPWYAALRDARDTMCLSDACEFARGVGLAMLAACTAAAQDTAATGVEPAGARRMDAAATRRRRMAAAPAPGLLRASVLFSLVATNPVRAQNATTLLRSMAGGGTPPAEASCPRVVAFGMVGWTGAGVWETPAGEQYRRQEGPGGGNGSWTAALLSGRTGVTWQWAEARRMHRQLGVRFASGRQLRRRKNVHMIIVVLTPRRLALGALPFLATRFASEANGTCAGCATEGYGRAYERRRAAHSTPAAWTARFDERDFDVHDFSIWQGGPWELDERGRGHRWSAGSSCVVGPARGGLRDGHERPELETEAQAASCGGSVAVGHHGDERAAAAGAVARLLLDGRTAAFSAFALLDGVAACSMAQNASGRRCGHGYRIRLSCGRRAHVAASSSSVGRRTSRSRSCGRTRGDARCRVRSQSATCGRHRHPCRGGHGCATTGIGGCTDGDNSTRNAANGQQLGTGGQLQTARGQCTTRDAGRRVPAATVRASVEAERVRQWKQGATLRLSAGGAHRIWAYFDAAEADGAELHAGGGPRRHAQQESHSARARRNGDGILSGRHPHHASRTRSAAVVCGRAGCGGGRIAAAQRGSTSDGHGGCVAQTRGHESTAQPRHASCVVRHRESDPGKA